jgi:peptidoglycan/LPS O-acetylase OafA/YrhL
MKSYRSEIDGLRAIALIAALSFHAKISFLPGAYLSIDSFFVISGYLITQIVLSDIDRGRFSFVTFYQRRMQRILPALFAMLIASCAAAWLLLPGDLALFGQSVAAVSSFSSNILFASWNNYFRLTNQMTPLLHTWSLGIEEQFYAMFPIGLFLMRHWRRTSLAAALVLAGLASFAYGLWLLHFQPDKAYFSLPARAWEFVVGALLATGLAPKITRPLVGDVLAAIGLVITAYLYFRLPEGAMPGARALAPCLASALILYGTNSEESRVARWLAFKPLAQLGLASYSIYLWHWPIMVFATYYVFDGQHALLLQRLTLLAAVPIGFLSLRCIEKPFRRPREILPRKPLFALAFALSAGLLVYGLFLSLARGFPERFGPEVAALNIESRQLHYPCADQPLASLPSNLRCRLGDPSAPAQFVVWGDSHAAMYHAVLDRIARDHHVAGYDVSAVGCAPLLDGPVINVRLRKCQTRNHDVLQALERLRPEVVILAGGWDVYFGAFPPGGDAADAALQKNRSQLGWQYTPPEMQAALGDVVDRLHRLGATIYFVHDVPGTGVATADRIAKSLILGSPPPPLPLRSRYESERAGVLALVGEFERRGLLRTIDPRPIYCGEATCRVGDGAGPFYLDDNHLTAHGAAQMAPMLEVALTSLGRPRDEPSQRPPRR